MRSFWHIIHAYLVRSNYAIRCAKIGVGIRARAVEPMVVVVYPHNYDMNKQHLSIVSKEHYQESLSHAYMRFDIDSSVCSIHPEAKC